MQSLTNNVKEIELFGKKLLLSERTARDVHALTEYSKKHGQNYTEAVIQSLIMLRDGLKVNFLVLKWWQLIKRFKLKRMLRKEFLLNNLSPRLIMELSDQIYELEGVDVKDLKKKITPEVREGLAVTLQTD